MFVVFIEINGKSTFYNTETVIEITVSRSKIYWRLYII